MTDVALTRSPRPWLQLLILLVAVRSLSQAWVGEDAYITLRAIDNLVNGHGLRWNPDERVQVFTHPLWMGIVAAAYAVTREIPWTLTVLGLAGSTGAFALLATRRGIAGPDAIGLPFLLFVTCPPLFLFATSGFENPLSALLLVAFATSYLDGIGQERMPWLRWTLLAALAATTRLDHLALLAPPLAYAFLVRRGRIPWMRCFVGLLPLVLWTGFALLYFGFATPNTAPAKLAKGVPTAWYLERGAGDLLALLGDHPAAAAILTLTALSTLGCAWTWCRYRGDRAAGARAALGLGVALYGAYVLRIGGDFLIGRFWTTPMWVGLVLIVRAWPAWRARFVRRDAKGRVAVVVATLALPLAVHVVAHDRAADLGPNGRPVLPRSAAHARLAIDGRFVRTEYAEEFRLIGERARDRAARVQGHAEKLGTIGFAGIAAGHDPILIDAYGLGDAFLARLRPRDGRIGHLRREVPVGYVHWRKTGSMERIDPRLHPYLEAIRRITSAPLFDRDRLRAIVDLNLGRLDHHLEAFEADRPPFLR